MTDKEELKKKIAAKTEECFQLASRTLARSFDKPTIVFEKRGLTGGVAWPTLNKLDFNLGIAANSPAPFISEIVPHEASHIIANKYFGKNCGHGPNWKYIMSHVLGVTPHRCHNLDTTGCRVRRTYLYKYACNCADGCKAGAKAHNRIQLGAKMVCLKCRSPIRATDFICRVDRH